MTASGSVRTRTVALATALACFALCMATAAREAHAQGQAATNSRFAALPLGASDGFYNIDATMRVLVDENDDHLYFWAQEFKFVRGDGGYMGLQTQGNLNNGNVAPRMVIFSIFDNGRDINGQPVATGVQAESANCVRHGATGEGAYVKCAMSYNWQIGTAYRLRIYEICCAESPGAREHWGGWIRNETTGVETFIGSISVPGAWEWLHTYANAFVEYAGPLVGQCTRIPYQQVRMLNPRANLGSVVATRGNKPAGYGQCLDFARGYTLNDRDWMESGLANSARDGVDQTVDHYYHAGLAREPDAPTRAHWIALVGDTTGTTCRENLRRVARDIHGSPEYATRWPGIGERVDRLYYSVLHRVPDAGRQTWIDYFNAHGGDWLATVNQFMISPEVTNRLGRICQFRY